MLFNWYNLFSLTDFLNTGMVSRTYYANLEGVGQKQILVTRGNEVSIIYEGVMLPVNFGEDNPYKRTEEETTYAVYQDGDRNIWLGIEVEE
jgi:hypothetical protein